MHNISNSYKNKFIMVADIWFIDGTFRSTPSDFYQLRTIHMLIFCKSFPEFYTLLKNKKESSYELILNQIKIF